MRYFVNYWGEQPRYTAVPETVWLRFKALAQAEERLLSGTARTHNE